MTGEATRICLWSGPRNISTALMYSFAERADTTVYDEPLYAHYLAHTTARMYHPCADEVIATMENDGDKVIRNVILAPQPTPVAFFKQMTHHLVELDWSFMKQTVNVILTRHPRDMLPSYAQQVGNPTLRDVGYRAQLELIEYLWSIGQEPPVLDAETTLRNPRGVLRKLCDRIGIPFDEVMMSWPAGARSEDGIWARHWYDSVHRSTGFQAYKPKTTPFPERLKPLFDESMPYYIALAKEAITASE